MKISFTEYSWSDYIWLQDYEKNLLKRVNLLIKDIQRNPFEGIGKPEPLKGNLSGYWSRRINSEHRIVYQIYQDELIIIAWRFPYYK